jgi:hypothetical protein
MNVQQKHNAAKSKSDCGASPLSFPSPLKMDISEPPVLQTPNLAILVVNDQFVSTTSYIIERMPISKTIVADVDDTRKISVLSIMM